MPPCWRHCLFAANEDSTIHKQYSPKESFGQFSSIVSIEKSMYMTIVCCVLTVESLYLHYSVTPSFCMTALLTPVVEYPPS
jgi:hypothetical protein